MEIRDPIHGTIELSSVEVAVLDSVAYQRLRMIKQLGFSEFSFPGATHNRYLHSIGVCHLAGQAFDSVFKDRIFSSKSVKARFRQCLRLAALLHDIGHGPLSHTTEEVMPNLECLNVKAYQHKSPEAAKRDSGRKADHEDYTVKFITDSSLTETIQENCSDIEPIHIACLIDKSLICPDDFFVDEGIDHRLVLSQIVSSEMDVDRMDYLERDAYFCGTNYGKVELVWLIANMTYHLVEDQMHLALNRRALYTFDDFLLARHHMHLMVYFHHKSIIFEEFLLRYLTSEDCEFKLPANIEEYIKCNDYALYQHLAKVDNEWAVRITNRQTYKMLFELHSTAEAERPVRMKRALEQEGLSVILSNSMARLSKYHTLSPEERAHEIFVVDEYDKMARPEPIQKSTKIFQRYEEIRLIDRLYVEPTQFETAEQLILQQRL